jgi:hypothetical protein
MEFYMREHAGIPVAIRRIMEHQRRSTAAGVVVRLHLLLTRVDTMLNLHARPELVMVMEESNRRVATDDDYAGNQAISQIAAIDRYHDATSFLSLSAGFAEQLLVSDQHPPLFCSAVRVEVLSAVSTTRLLVNEVTPAGHRAYQSAPFLR